MHVDKNRIIDLLNSTGDDTQAEVAESLFPEIVDTDKDAVLLDKLGIDPQDLTDKSSGGFGG